MSAKSTEAGRRPVRFDASVTQAEIAGRTVRLMQIGESRQVVLIERNGKSCRLDDKNESLVANRKLVASVVARTNDLAPVRDKHAGETRVVRLSRARAGAIFVHNAGDGGGGGFLARG